MGDPQRWDERYRRGEHASDQPSPFFESVAASLTPRRALDLACGAGRHTLMLASRGWQVLSVDGSRVAIELLQNKLDPRAQVTTKIADLERGELTLDADSFDLIIVAYYMNRELIPAIRAAVRPGGHAALAVHFDDAPSPKVAARGELRGLFADWEVLIDNERERDEDPGDRHHHGTAELFARRPTR